MLMPNACHHLAAKRCTPQPRSMWRRLRCMAMLDGGGVKVGLDRCTRKKQNYQISESSQLVGNMVLSQQYKLAARQRLEASRSWLEHTHQL